MRVKKNGGGLRGEMVRVRGAKGGTLVGQKEPENPNTATTATNTYLPKNMSYCSGHFSCPSQIMCVCICNTLCMCVCLCTGPGLDIIIVLRSGGSGCWYGHLLVFRFFVARRGRGGRGEAGECLL